MANSLESHNIEAIGLMLLQANQLCEANDFGNQIFNFYYEPTHTEVELAEKTANDPVVVEDIEALIEIVRNMYSYHFLLYGARSIGNYENQRHGLMAKSNEK